MGPCWHVSVAEDSGHLQSEEQHAPSLQAGAVLASEEDPPRGLADQDMSAGEAGSVLGLDPDGDHVVMLSVIPGETEDKLSPEPSGGTCGARGEEDSRCSLREHIFSLDGVGPGFQDREEEYYSEPEVAESDPAPPEDSNNTESLKSPKVNCEERNVTGLENFTLKILNMSQVRKNGLALFSFSAIDFIDFQLLGQNFYHFIGGTASNGCITANSFGFL